MSGPTLTSTLRSPALLLASWGGVGLSPIAPGTVGSIFALPLCLWIVSTSLVWVLLLAGLLWVAGTWSAAKAGSAWGQVDHPAIVIDEVLGQLIAIAIPWFWSDGVASPLWLAASGFFFFRCFDIAKPWPIRQVDRAWKTPSGVMFDDVAAGIFAGVVTTAAVTLAN